MRRQWNSLRDEYGEGSEEARALGLTLAGVADPEFIRAILNLKCAADQFGGHVFIEPYRVKLDAEGNRVHPDEPGTFVTAGYLYHYEHVPKALKGGAPEPDASLSAPIGLLPEVDEPTAEPELQVPPSAEPEPAEAKG